MSRQVVTQEVLQKLIQRLNTLEQEIREIKKAIVVTQEEYVPEFPAIKQEQQLSLRINAKTYEFSLWI